MDSVLRRIADHFAAHLRQSAIDPIEIAPDLLPYIFILGVEMTGDRAEPRLLIRLTGTALDAAFGRCVKGAYLENFLHGNHSASVLAGFRRCAVARKSIWMRQVVRISNRAPRYVEGVAFHVDPDLIYGGLVVGEITDRDAPSSFESREL